ncbi:Mitochondrial distribution and morphology protein 12 [Basidiobolus ranarum]|uniref:Mitochondrial distribution and morphology protein 12 n=1 Tax=Basidiobolus ranarum TaxID=34480 RepID=A0ABR2X1Q2_9FUNG
MSFEIFWEKLDSEIASSIRDKLNSRFQQIKRPSFLGEIEVLEFNFGSIPPVVEIVDITDPFPEFYWTDDEEDEYNCTDGLSENDSFCEGSSMGGDTASHLSFTSSQRITQPKLHPDSFFVSQPPSVFSDDGYFEPQSIHSENLRHTEPSTRTSPMDSSHSSRNHAPVKQDSDVQIHFGVSYSGDMRLTISTELRLNYPSIAFMSLPVRLTVTGFSFSAVAAIAHLRDRVNFCFLEPKNPKESLLGDIHIESEIGDNQKQVLKNVGQIERFIVEQLRKLIDEEFVFPCYHSIDLVPSTHSEF